MRNWCACLVFKCCLALISVTHTWFHGDWFLSDDTIQVGGGGALAQIDHRHVSRNSKGKSYHGIGSGNLLLYKHKTLSVSLLLFLLLLGCVK